MLKRNSLALHQITGLIVYLKSAVFVLLKPVIALNKVLQECLLRWSIIKAFHNTFIVRQASFRQRYYLAKN